MKKEDMESQNNGGLISVIIPIYNSEKYLNQCVDSVLNQSYSNVEVILVDDGSTDSSPQICDAYAEKDKRVRVIHQKNARIGAARNAGIELSVGDFLTFIDSDDYIDQNTYLKAINLIDKYDADMVQWDLTFSPEPGCKDVINNRPQADYKELVLNNIDSLNKLFEWKNMDADFNNMWTATHCIWTKLFKKEVLGDIRFPVGKEYEDEMILHRVIRNSQKTVFVNERFSTYRLRASSTVHTMPMQGKLDKIDAFLDRFDMIVEMNEPKLLPGITHDCLASIYYGYLQAKKEKNKEACKYLRSKADNVLKNSKKYVDKKDNFIGKLLVNFPIGFRFIFGMYVLTKHRG